MKKILFMAAAACLLFAACKNPQSPAPDNNNQNQNQENNNNDANNNANNENNDGGDDEEDTDDEIREFVITGVDEYSLWEKSEDGKTITLTTKEGAATDYEPKYTLSGDFEGQIKTTAKGTVLHLNGVKLSNKDAPVIYAEKKAEIKTEAETTNTITTTGDYVEKADAAAILGKKKIEIGGSGTLIVSGTVNHGIKAKGDEIEVKGSGTITVSGSSKGSAINCDTFTVKPANKEGVAPSFTLNLKDSSNGVKADLEIKIQAGTFNLSNLTNGFKTEAGGTITTEGAVVNFDNVTNHKVIPEDPPAES